MLKLPDGRPAIMSDTVGFISDLPHELVEAFRATLEEVKEADVILHVRDIASLETEAEADDVRKVLAEIGVVEDSSHRVLEVWNKADLLNGDAGEFLAARARRSDAVAVSAVTGEGCDDLLARLAELVDDGPLLTLTLDAADGEGLAWLYRHGRVLERHDGKDGSVRLAVSLSPQALGQFEQQFPSAEVRAH
jgi:GTP-binding protein HflX